jgi:hypothetical protein
MYWLWHARFDVHSGVIISASSFANIGYVGLILVPLRWSRFCCYCCCLFDYTVISALTSTYETHFALFLLIDNFFLYLASLVVVALVSAVICRCFFIFFLLFFHALNVSFWIGCTVLSVLLAWWCTVRLWGRPVFMLVLALLFRRRTRCWSLGCYVHLGYFADYSLCIWAPFLYVQLFVHHLHYWTVALSRFRYLGFVPEVFVRLTSLMYSLCCISLLHNHYIRQWMKYRWYVITEHKYTIFWVAPKKYYSFSYATPPSLIFSV